MGRIVINNSMIMEMYKLFKDFKVVAIKGNGMDVAIRIIIGAAFGKIVALFVGDILMPIMSMFLGKMDECPYQTGRTAGDSQCWRKRG